MPPQATKSLFLDFDTYACRTLPVVPATAARIKQDGQNAWNAMSVLQRADYVRLHRLIVEVDGRRDEASQAADDLTALALNQRVANPVHWKNMVKAAEAAAAQFRVLETLQSAVINAVDDLRTLAYAIPQLHIRVRARTSQDLIDEQNRLTFIRAEIARLQNDADYPPVPQRPWPPAGDGRFKILESSLSQNREAARQASRRNVFKTTRHAALVPFNANPAATWEGAWMIGEGGMSNTGLFIQYDNAWCVNFRVMKKDTDMSREHWASVASFDGDVRNMIGRQPLELSCHDAMQWIPSSSTSGPGMVPAATVPLLYSSATFNGERTYTMYLEYCPFLDLATIIRRYRSNGDAIPEPFIWYVFLSLAEAGLAMERGNQSLLVAPPGWPADQYGRIGWQIIHRDLKPSNVFLGAHTVNHFDDYPTPKVGDFGLAVKTFGPGDGLNPDIYLDGGGTYGFRAPETRSYLDRTTLDPLDRWPLSNYTNIWGFGMIIYCLMSLDNRPAQKDWLGNANMDVPNVGADARMAYSNELVQEVRQCLSPDPTTRPDFQGLLPRIQSCIQNLGLAQGMQNQTVDAMELPFLTLVHQPQDGYALGLHRNLIPPP
ncbi:hypothetical protein LTR85_008987 [Meristemomyces frigidus]|nr:hypothetical protein LTR85_008987 [Meristemomyces frigidus]